MPYKSKLTLGVKQLTYKGIIIPEEDSLKPNTLPPIRRPLGHKHTGKRTN